MELEFRSFFFVVAVVVCLFLFSVMLIKNTKKRSESVQRLPPGPHKLPIIGSLHCLIGGLPHRVLRDLATKYGPVMYLRLGQVDHIILSSPEAAEFAMRTRDTNFASRPELTVAKIVMYGCTNIVFAPYGVYWRQLRKICILELLSARRVKLSRSLREEEAANLVAGISAAAPGAVNVSKMLLSTANETTARAAFGKRCRQKERFISVGMEIISLGSGFSMGDLFPSMRFMDTVTGLKSRLERCHRQIDDILTEIIEEHRARGVADRDESCEEDLLDVLLRIKDHGGLEIPLTVDNVKAVVFDMFLAGTETTSSTVESAMAELIRNPSVMEKAQTEVREALRGNAKVEEDDIGDLHYLKLVIKETLRLHPPFPLELPRVCTETCEIDGFTIPAQSRILINAWALARDPRVWVDAESFKPERFNENSIDFKGNNYEYLPFGGGRRICPGMTFALASVELTLAQILFHFNWDLPDRMNPKDLDMTETFGGTVRRKNHLCLIATPYISSSFA